MRNNETIRVPEAQKAPEMSRQERKLISYYLSGGMRGGERAANLALAVVKNMVGNKN